MRRGWPQTGGHGPGRSIRMHSGKPISRIGILFALLMMVPFWACGLLLIPRAIQDSRAARDAAQWPTTIGTLSKAEVRQRQHDGNTTYHVETAYQYQVDGQIYTGSRIAFGQSSGEDKARYQQIADALNSGSTVLVRYNPQQPGQAVLAYGTGREEWPDLLFGTFWLLACAGFTSLIWLGRASSTSKLDMLEVVKEKPKNSAAS